ncbi:hypothetical protein C8F01DRAFT_1260225 [Mycena amicta]|nr:hypothetical protein C8F01DRAFT_1260225 [Mycena amicta]
MSAPAAARPTLAWGYLPHNTRALPQHPSRTQAGHPDFRAVACFDIAGSLQHYLVPLNRSGGRGNNIREQISSFRPFWTNSPLRCTQCRDLLITAYGESTPAAYTFLTACRHAPGAEDPGSHDSDDNDPDVAIEDRDRDVVPNGATMRVVADVGYHRIRGNFLVVKHSVVLPLPQDFMDAELYDVETEDFELIHGLVRRHLAGDSRDYCAEFLPSPYVFHNIRG